MVLYARLCYLLSLQLGIEGNCLRMLSISTSSLGYFFHFEGCNYDVSAGLMYVTRQLYHRCTIVCGIFPSFLTPNYQALELLSELSGTDTKLNMGRQSTCPCNLMGDLRDPNKSKHNPRRNLF